MINMKYTVYSICLFIFVVGFSSCGEEQYFKTKAALIKKSDECKPGGVDLVMNSNINGDRYSFHICLQDNFDNADCVITRSHDSVFVNFRKSPQLKQVQYEATIDIDTYPRYNFLIIEGEAFAVIPAGN
jgi:hypothetical protein